MLSINNKTFWILTSLAILAINTTMVRNASNIRNFDSISLRAY